MKENEFEKNIEIDEHNIKNILKQREVLSEVLKIINDSPDIQKALEELSEATDKHTVSHILRTANDACRVSIFRKLPEDEVNLLIRAALLHDVGKIEKDIARLVVSSEKFNRDSKERKILEDHTRLGKNHCEKINLSEESKIVVAHHEKTEGYPRDSNGSNERRQNGNKFYSSDKRNGDRRENNIDPKIEKLIDLFNIIDQCDAMLNERSYKKYSTGDELKERIGRLKKIFPQYKDVIDFLIDDKNLI